MTQAIAKPSNPSRTVRRLGYNPSSSRKCVCVSIDFLAAFRAEGGFVGVLFSAAFAHNQGFGFWFFYIFLNAFEGLLYFFSSGLKRFLHLNTHFREGFSPILNRRCNTCFNRSFSPIPTFGAEIRIIWEFLATMRAESHNIAHRRHFTERFKPCAFIHLHIFSRSIVHVVFLEQLILNAAS